MTSNLVADEEVLYRSISFKHSQCTRDASGRWKLSSQAFSDRTMRPSVDRASLCDSNPSHTQKSPKDGVVSIVANEVRNIKDVTQNDANGNVLITHVFDVIADPIDPENPAHALIISTPEYANSKVFKRLLERLVRIADSRGWQIEPQE